MGFLSRGFHDFIEVWVSPHMLYILWPHRLLCRHQHTFRLFRPSYVFILFFSFFFRRSLVRRSAIFGAQAIDCCIAYSDFVVKCQFSLKKSGCTRCVGISRLNPLGLLRQSLVYPGRQDMCSIDVARFSCVWVSEPVWPA